jgi:hypothetical protein
VAASHSSGPRFTETVAGQLFWHSCGRVQHPTRQVALPLRPQIATAPTSLANRLGAVRTVPQAEHHSEDGIERSHIRHHCDVQIPPLGNWSPPARTVAPVTVNWTTCARPRPPQWLIRALPQPKIALDKRSRGPVIAALTRACQRRVAARGAHEPGRPDRTGAQSTQAVTNAGPPKPAMRRAIMPPLSVTRTPDTPGAQHRSR